MAAENNEVILHDPDTLEEINNFVFAESRRKAGAAPGFTDDLVMSLMLSLHGAKLYPQTWTADKPREIKTTKDPDVKRDWRIFKERLMKGRSKQGSIL